MAKKVTLSMLDKILNKEINLQRQEQKALSYDGMLMPRHEAVMLEISELSFHLSRFAMEGADLETINNYKTILDYVKLKYEKDHLSTCERLLTTLKLMCGLDVTFFTTLPSIREHIMETGPITLESLSNTIKKELHKIDIDDNNNTNNWRRNQ